MTMVHLTHMKPKSPFKILLVGGGTGGHFYPLIAIAEALNRLPDGPQLYYAGPDHYNADALQRTNIDFVRVGAGKRRRYVSILNLFDSVRTFFGIFGAIIKLFWVYPDVVMSKGGYTSVPVVLAAAFLRIPIVVHESDAVMGRANRLGSRFARYLITSYEGISFQTKAEQMLLGIPVRTELSLPPRQDAIERLGIDPERPVLLVVGGSQGAERINNLILDSLDELLRDFTILHQTGEAHHTICVQNADKLIQDAAMRAHYHPVPTLDAASLNDAYHLAGVIVARAGSGSIYEIALHGKPSILIPIPEEISHDQRTNAYTYARTGAAVVIEEKNLSDGLLRSEIDRIMLDQGVYASMSTAASNFGRPDAAEKVATLLIGIAQEHVK
jgi:UDP-N-acetylglucosamine--N-acetylmuramyl-(pentapeptide) pyrophosphoryl-undecaprenol N-acetylglucosamine transferase